MSTDILDKQQADLIDMTVPIVKMTPTWDDMLEVFNRVMEANVDAPIEQLERIRFISGDTEDAILSTTARLLGFDLSADVLSMNGDNLVKLVSQLPLYADQNGTDLFIKFIDLIFNAQTIVQNLYTQDYVNFLDAPKGPLVIDGGTWFKTTHIDLSIQLFHSEAILLNEGVKLIDKVQELFFSLAPVALVVYRTNFTEAFDDMVVGFDTYMPYAEATVVID